MTSDKILKDKRVTHVNTWKNSVPGRGNNQGKVPNTGACYYFMKLL